MKDYIISRLQEPSTWRGCVLIITALGIKLSPDLQEGIITLGLALAGGIGITTKD